MDAETVRHIATKILKRDYDRWLQYSDSEIKDRSAFGCSFFSWKEKNNMLKKDIDDLVELLSNG